MGRDGERANVGGQLGGWHSCETRFVLEERKHDGGIWGIANGGVGACDKSGNRNVIRHAIRNVMRLAVRRDHETCGKTHLLP